MEAPPFPGANPPSDPQVDAFIAHEHARASHPGWYLFGKATGYVLTALAEFSIFYGALLLALVVIGGFDLSLREVLGIMLAAAVMMVGYRNIAT